MKENKNIDKFFKDALYNYNVEPPQYIWEDIKGDILKSKQTKRRVYFSAVAASVAIIISFLSGYYFTGTNTSKLISENTVSQIVKPSNEIVSNSSLINTGIVENNSIKKTVSKTPIIEKELKIEKNNSNKENDNSFSKTNNIAQLSNKLIDKISAVITLKKVLSIKKRNNLNTLAFQPITSEDKEKVKVYEGFVEEKEIKNTWALAGQFSPSYLLGNKLNPKIDQSSMLLTQKDQASHNNEKALLAYNSGMKVGYTVFNRLTIESGLYYSKLGQQIDNARIDVNELAYYDGGELIEANSYTTSSMVGEIRYNTQASNSNDINVHPSAENTVKSVYVDSKLLQNFEYLEIPVMVKYKVIDRKVDMQLQCGLSPGFLITNKVYFEQNNAKQWIGYTEGMNSVNYRASLGIGIDYPLSKSLSINFEPTLRYSLNSISQFSEIKPYSVGIFTGISYFFN
ncbi:MAG: PorT family protein [Chlorobi bacterium]|nr:PorT family protein [Chlorobiota bacterium]